MAQAGSTQVKLPNLAYLRKKDPRLYETFRAIQRALLPPTQSPPPPVNSINVVASGNGWVDVAFTDNGPVTQAVNYFVEHDSNPNFTNPRIEDFGAVRVGTILVGSGGRFYRVYSQYRFPPSQPSPPLIFRKGGIPVVVEAGGPLTAQLQPSTGSGTASTNGQQGGQGFGKQSVRATPPRVL